MFNSKESMKKAKDLAREFIKIDQSIQKIISNQELAFDVYKHEKLGWIIQTFYCQMGRCLVDYIICDCEKSAINKAAEMTLHHKQPNHNDLCFECKDDYLSL